MVDRVRRRSSAWSWSPPRSSSGGCRRAVRPGRRGGGRWAGADPAPATRSRLGWVGPGGGPGGARRRDTAHLSVDVAAVPLLWVVPLAVYLATFVLAFAARGRSVSGSPTCSCRRSPSAWRSASSTWATLPPWVVFSVHLGALAASGSSATGGRRWPGPSPTADRLRPGDRGRRSARGAPRRARRAAPPAGAARGRRSPWSSPSASAGGPTRPARRVPRDPEFGGAAGDAGRRRDPVVARARRSSAGRRSSAVRGHRDGPRRWSRLARAPLDAGTVLAALVLGLLLGLAAGRSSSPPSSAAVVALSVVAAAADARDGPYVLRRVHGSSQDAAGRHALLVGTTFQGIQRYHQVDPPSRPIGYYHPAAPRRRGGGRPGARRRVDDRPRRCSASGRWPPMPARPTG